MLFLHPQVISKRTEHNAFLNRCVHIDQLTRIMHLVGTPSSELLAKITSEEVGQYLFEMGGTRFVVTFKLMHPVGNY